jgi:hypothetical protein
MKSVKALFTALVVICGSLTSINSTAAVDGLKVWQPCVSQSEDACIEGITLISASGQRINAVVSPEIRNYSDGFAQQQLLGSPREWITPGVIHENKTEKIILKAFYFPLGTSYCWTPVDCAKNIDEIVLDLGGGWWGNGQSPKHFPEESSDLICGNPQQRTYCVPGWGVNPDYQYEVQLRLPKSFQPSMSVGEGLNGEIRLVESTPLYERVAVLSTPATKSFRWTRYNASGPVDFNQKADHSINVISIYMMSNLHSNVSWLRRCSDGKGMSIWHNGSIQQYPQWDAANQQMTIKIAGMHLKPDGSPNVGTFNVAMPLDIAQCLWNVDLSKKTNALLSASYDNSGVSEIITVTSAVRGNIFYLSGNGFHYSVPTLSLKLTQVVTPAASPSPTATPTPTASAQSKKKSITCVKGKITKKVTALKPQCPAGYKKK